VDASRTDSIAVKYDPMGNRVYKSSTVDGVETACKYVVDISGKLPTILCIADAGDPNLLISSYTYAGAQVLSQRQYPVLTDPNIYDEQFYVHDRLGSVRLVVDYNDVDEYVSVANSYTYTPFGSHYDGEGPAETLDNPFKFTGQWHDSEINQYYLRARMYDPTMMRFTGRDPVRGEYFEPLTLHKYLYCSNDSLNKTDCNGKSALQIANGLRAASLVYAAGLGIAAYGADTGNLDLISLGGFVMEMSPVAFALGFSATPSVVQVTRWGGDFRPGSYGIQGGSNLFNYMKTMKWLPNQFAPIGSASTAYYLADSLYMPTGALSYIDILFGFVKVPF
jgi:RHS repeat-associated protein